jgi:hypothetical protein
VLALVALVRRAGVGYTSRRGVGLGSLPSKSRLVSYFMNKFRWDVPIALILVLK